MKRKAFISMIVVVALAFSLTVPAMANGDDHANAPQDVDPGTEVMVPNPDGDDPPFIPEPARPSHGRTTLTDFEEGTNDNWQLSLGDDTDQTPERRSDNVDIAVWAKIIDLGNEADLIYCIDIEWGNMRFVFGRNSGAWNPEARTYGEVDEGSWWVDNEAEGAAPTEFYLDGENNRVTVTNRSNAPINAGFEYRFFSRFDGEPGGDEDDNLFNKPATDDNLVVGNFFHVPVDVDDANILEAAGNPYDEDQIINALINGHNLAREAAADAANDAAKLAALILEDDGSSVQDKVEEIPEWLDTEIKIIAANDPAHIGVQGTLPSETVMFAFSGTPDNDSDLLGAAFTKVGIITVTITPYDNGFGG